MHAVALLECSLQALQCPQLERVPQTTWFLDGQGD